MVTLSTCCVLCRLIDDNTTRRLSSHRRRRDDCRGVSRRGVSCRPSRDFASVGELRACRRHRCQRRSSSKRPAVSTTIVGVVVAVATSVRPNGYDADVRVGQQSWQRSIEWLTRRPSLSASGSRQRAHSRSSPLTSGPHCSGHNDDGDCDDARARVNKKPLSGGYIETSTSRLTKTSHCVGQPSSIRLHRDRTVRGGESANNERRAALY